MCGIWSYILDSNNVFTSDEFKELNKNISKVKFRGPDKTNLIKLPQFYLGFHRLSIHDLSPLGDQPFIYQDDKNMIYILCNGEIYNYKDIINNFNFSLSSNSDCEVIYHLFKITNYDIKKTLSYLNGEFAFIIIVHNLVDNKITSYTARDSIGVRPLFWGKTKKGIVFSSIIQGLTNICESIQVFTPGTYMIYNQNQEQQFSYYNFVYPNLIVNPSNITKIYEEITSRIIEAVKIRIDSDRPIGCLLSGGLDSSIIVGILVKILKIPNIKTFNITLNDDLEGTDSKYANMVAKHLNTDHTEIKFDYDDGLNNIPNVIQATESYDITTIRASVCQFLISKYIAENTDIKVVLNGDGADEVEMGYLYFHNNPNPEEAQEESIKLVKEIHLYDGLRVDRCISYHGLEARIPYLDTNFVDYYMSLPPHLKAPNKQNLEKQLIRDAFFHLYPDILPYDVLMRKKEALSDAVSSKQKSWYQIIQDYVDTIITDEEYEQNKTKYIFNPPKTKEAYWYRKLFDEYFGDEYSNVIPHMWLPNWCGNIFEPSARVLDVYN